MVDAHILHFNYNLIKGHTAIQLPYEYVLANSKMITPRKYYAMENALNFRIHIKKMQYTLYRCNEFHKVLMDL